MPDLSDGVNWSEIDANNNNAPPNGWPEGMMPSGVNDAARADRGAMKRFWDKINPVQKIAPSGGIYTFTTANPTYPTAYMDGEIYCFHPTGASVGSDQFQVNSLGPKPIWKRLGLHLWSLIFAQDILNGSSVQVVYDAGLGSGAGGFLLLDPFVPISGDGAGGVAVPNLEVTGVLTMDGPVIANDGMLVNGALQVIGPMTATGYSSRSGTAGPYQTNVFNIQWAGADGAHLWIDTTDEGRILCVPASGDIVITGQMSAASLTTTGAISAGGALSVTGNITSGNITAGAITATSLATTGAATIGGNMTISGSTTAADISGHTLTASGGITVNAGGVNIVAGGLYVGGGSPITATGTISATGNLSTTGSCLVGDSLYMGGASFPTLTGDGGFTALYAHDATVGLQACFLIGPVSDPTNYSRNGSHKFDDRSGSTTYAIFNGSPPYAYKPGGGTWGASSDVRLKHQITDYTAGLPEIEQLRPVRFRFNGKGGTSDDGTVFTGLVADEVRGVMPEMIGTLRAKLDPEDELEVDLLTLDATSLIYALVNSVQELAGEISMVKKLLKEKR